MAEAHAAVAFSFSVSPDGVNVQVSHEALWAVVESWKLSWRKEWRRLQNRFYNRAYPASPMSWLFGVTFILFLTLAQYDVSLGLVQWIENNLPSVLEVSPPWDLYLSCVISATILWFLMVYSLKTFLTMLLSYMSWMYEPRGRVSFKTKAWLYVVRLLGGRKPLLYSWQGALPKLPLPTLEDTLKRHLLSVRPLMDDENYERMVKLSDEFAHTIGNKLQWYLRLKHWWAPNYVSDWWEEYVYLRGRSPIMVNSNFYGMDAILIHPSNVQIARAANIIHAMLQFRRMVERETLQPILLNKTVPLCSLQYERTFNTTRIPGIETDQLKHWKDSNHLVVYHRGRYFKVYVKEKGRIFAPCEIEYILQQILDDESDPVPGELHLAALTAGEREPWARARHQYFRSGVNKASLETIDRSAFFVSLDDEEHDYDPEDDTKLDGYCRALLHGNGYNRWFDKSFTLCVFKNGRIGFNGEHSWADAPILAHAVEYSIYTDILELGADAPIMAHVWEYSIAEDVTVEGYKGDGHTLGLVQTTVPTPIRLHWDLSKDCQAVIQRSLLAAKQLLEDVDSHLLVHNSYGKGFMKKCRVSPDAYIQMALQLAYYMDAGKFALTYESSMTRLFKEGRTETVRSCTIESSAFVKAMQDTKSNNKERAELFKTACERHQTGYRDAMTGKGIDRHLFCLYVISKYLDVESPFLSEVLSEPWTLSTSQTPLQQTDKLDLARYPDYISAGGGFGPVSDEGYGVSYIVAGEEAVFFHISCKNKCKRTNSRRFGDIIKKAMADIRELMSQPK